MAVTLQLVEEKNSVCEHNHNKTAELIFCYKLTSQDISDNDLTYFKTSTNHNKDKNLNDSNH